MKKLFVIGGMGAGKSTVRKALTDQGLPFIDLDCVGHEILKWDAVKNDLRETFGEDVFGEDGEVVRPLLAAKAFQSPADTRKLNRITMPRIEEVYTDRLSELEKEGCEAVVVEYSVFKNRLSSLAYSAEVVIAVLAPLESRIERAVASGVAASPGRSPTPIASRRPTSCSTTIPRRKSCATRSSPGGASTARPSSPARALR